MKAKAKVKSKPRKKYTGRGPNKFKKTEVGRLLRATLAAGVCVSRVEVDPISGRIIVVAGKPEANKGNELDTWMETHAHSTQGAQ